MHVLIYVGSFGPHVDDDITSAMPASFQSFLDDRESFHTTYKLVYSDLQGSPQQAVAMHITEEGLRLRCG